jgi:hypothetical protein
VVTVGEARAVAARWVAAEAARMPGFAGAFLAGSTTWLPASAELPTGSDVDVSVVLDVAGAPAKPGKFARDGVLLEPTYLTWDELASPETVLSTYHQAGNFRTDTVLADPTGRLGALRDAVSREFGRRRWVELRCADAERRIVRHLGRIAGAAPGSGGADGAGSGGGGRDGAGSDRGAPDGEVPFHDLVTAWAFGTGVTTHVLLTAGLRNPTVRLRYVATRELLGDHGRSEWQEDLLELLGCAHLPRRRVERHLREMTAVFDATAPLARTPFFFSSDITAAARPVAVDGSGALIARGHHREAVFWIVATYARCLKILAADAPAAGARFAPGFRELAADLGVATPAEVRRRARRTTAFLPRLREMAREIAAATPGVYG